MNDVARLLQDKELALRRVKREIEALRLSAALLAEPSEKHVAHAGLGAPVAASGVRSVPITVLPFTRELEMKRQHDDGPGLHIQTGRPPIFPESRDGIIVCDACGHRNPDYLLDCESCDIPIRLRS